MKSKWLLILCNIIIAFSLTAEQIPLWQEIPRNFFEGILKANYKQVPLREMLIEDKIYIPLPQKKLDSTHPRLLPIDNSVQIKKQFSPYKGWAKEIIFRAETNYIDPASSLINETKRSEFAKYAAFSYYLTGKAQYLDDVKLALINISPTLPPQSAEGGIFNEGWGDWMQAAEALRNFALAYDLTYDNYSIAEKGKIENSLSEQTEQIYQHFSHFPTSFKSRDLAIGLGIPKNNHIIDITTGVITVALVIDSPRSRLWLETALDELGKGLGQILPDGSYTEGGYYAQYIASRLFQFALYYDNAAGVNIHKIPRIKKFTQWLLDIERNDGSVPMWDDAMPDRYFYLPMMVGPSSQSNFFAAKFYGNPDNYETNDSRLIEAFCAFDAQIQPQQFPRESKYYLDGGQLLFQNQNIEALLLAEPENSFSKHDHIDPLSFTFSAYDQHFLIDSGYGLDGVNDKNRDWFISPEANNLPLVNSFGPDQNPIWGDSNLISVSHKYSSDNITTAQVNSHYRQADISRTAILPKADYMIIIDSLDSNEMQRYSIPWQGRGDFRFVSDDTAQWRQDTAKLNLKFISNQAGELRYRLGLNSYGIGDGIHQTAEYALKPTKSAKVISLILPENIENKLMVEEIFPQSSKSVQAYQIRSGLDEDFIILAESAWSYRDFASDAKFAFIQNDFYPSLLLKEVSWLEYNGEKIFTSDAKIDLVIELQSHWKGEIENPGKGQISFYPPKSTTALFIDNKLEEFEMIGEKVIFGSASGIFSFNTTVKKEAEVLSKPYYPILFKLQTGLYGNSEGLTRLEENQLRNEIVQYTMQELDLIDEQYMSNSFKKIYGLATGILDNLWDAEDDFGFSLPQIFQLDRVVNHKKISYQESGRIGGNGFTAYFQNLNIADKLYLSRQTPFSEYQLNRMDYYHENGSIFSQWQNYDGAESYLVSTRQNWQNHKLSLALYGDEEDETWQEIGYSGKAQSHKIRMEQFPQNSTNYQLDSDLHSAIYQLNSSVVYQDEIEEVDLNQNIYLSPQMQFHTRVNWLDEKYNYYGSIYGKIKNLYSTVDFLYQDSLRFSTKNSYRQNGQVWSWELQNLEELSSLFNWQGAIFHSDCELSWDSAGDLATTINLPVEHNLAFTCQNRYDWKNGENGYISLGTALYADNYYWINLGCEKLDDEYLPLLEFVSKFRYAQKNFCDLRIYTNWLKYDLNDLVFELENDQGNWSPGIKITIDEGDVTNGEGYVSWWF